MDAYKIHGIRNDEYNSKRKEEHPTQFVNRDNGREYEREISRLQRALQNYNAKSEREEKKDAEQESEQPDILEQLDRGDWRNMDADVMTRFWEEHGTEMSKSERAEFLDVLMEKTMKESEQLIETDIEIIKTGSEMKSSLENIQSTTDNLEVNQNPDREHGTELEPQSNGANQDDLRPPEILLQDRDVDHQTDVARVEIETPLQSADRAMSEIASQLENQGYEKISSEIQEIGRIEHEFKTLETELDVNPLAQPESAQPLDMATRVDLSTAPEIVEPFGAETKANTLHRNEIGDSEIG